MTGLIFIGDANPLDHGGAWLTKVGEKEYVVVKVEPCQNRIDHVYFYNVHVDLTDSWIDLQRVQNFCDARDDAELALGCLDYYGPANFGQSEDIYLMQDEIRKLLERRGINVDEEHDNSDCECGDFGCKVCGADV